MTYQVLARKWRPKRFEEVLGQQHVTRSLQNSLRSGKLAHAYLFTGTRGVGKTSIARLFAKAVRCENRDADMNPCLKCISCEEIEKGQSLDYLEIDGASHNSVDNIRELIENVRYLPARGQHKLYVIDEVHMLSVSAFNALLKTLEEPPEHVIFVFATTDAHKLLGTVLSRCQRFDFKSLQLDTLVGHIKFVASKEGIKFEDEALITKLAELGKGSARDTLSLFDQVLSLAGGKVIDETTFYQSLGLARAGTVKNIIGHILTEKPMDASKLFQGLLAENIELKRLIDQMLDAFYAIIQKIDSPEEAYAMGLLPDGALSGITYAELFWVYETFAKDCVWGLASPSPDKVMDLVIQKLSRRRQILKPDHAVIQSSGIKSTPVMKAAPVKKAFVPTFEEFLSAMQDAPTIRANLEFSNFLEKPKWVGEELHLHLGFIPEDTAAKEYIQDTEVFTKLKTKIQQIFEVKPENLKLTLKVLDAQESQGFISYHQKNERQAAQHKEERTDRLLNDPFVKEAEKLFNAKIDKVILKESKA